MEIKKKQIIMDMDISGDCTNIGALATLHALADEGEAEILCTTVGLDTPYVAACPDAVNRYYGRGDIPVGTLHGKAEPQYRVCAEQICKEYITRYPENAPTEDAVHLIRRVLAKVEDGSVTFVIVGHLSVAAGLLDSAPDENCPLTGKELIKAKICRTVVMAGRFWDTFGDEPAMEWNISLDVPAARHFCKDWPGAVAFSAFEIGIRVPSVPEFIRTGAMDNPVRRAYELETVFRPELKNAAFPSWDSTAVLEAIFPGKYFAYHEKGRIRVDENGMTHWEPEQGANQTYLLPKVSFEQVGAEITRLIEKAPALRK